MTARGSEQSSPAQPLVTRVAIVGSGAVANHHARHLAGCPSARLVAVVDLNRAAAESFAAKWRVSRLYGSLGELLSAGEVDAVHITTPPDSHESLARQAVEGGLDVLLEKPIAYTRAATARLYELAHANRVRLVPDYSLFFVEQMCRAREWVAEGRVGRIVCVECLYQTQLDRARLEEPTAPPWLFELPGGPLHNFFTHPLYLTLQFTGPVNGLHVVPRHAGYLPQGLTDNLDLLIDGAHCSAFVTVSLAARPSQTCLVIHGEKGRITVEFDSFQISLERAPARLGSVMRLLRPSLRGMGAIRQTGATALKVLRKRLLPYAGLKALIERFYASPQSVANCRFRKTWCWRLHRLKKRLCARPESGGFLFLVPARLRPPRRGRSGWRSQAVRVTSAAASWPNYDGEVIACACSPAGKAVPSRLAVTTSKSFTVTPAIWMMCGGWWLELRP